VEGRPNRRNEAAFSNVSGVMWTLLYASQLKMTLLWIFAVFYVYLFLVVNPLTYEVPYSILTVHSKRNATRSYAVSNYNTVTSNMNVPPRNAVQAKHRKINSKLLEISIIRF